MRAYWRWATGKEIQFLRNYKLPIALVPEPHPLPGGIDDVVKLIAFANTEEHKAIIGLCGLAGLRIAESLNVQVKDLEIGEKVTLKVRGKGDKMREVPISENLWQLLVPLYFRVYPVGSLINLDNRSARSMITRAGQRANLKRNIASHDLRMTFATALYNQTKDIRLVQRLLGHSDTKTTAKYIAVEMDNMHSAVSELVPV